MEIDSGSLYNQISGKNIVAYLKKGKLKRTDVNGSALSIYYPEDEEKTDTLTTIKRMGLNRLESSKLTVHLDSGEVTGITYITEPVGVFYPMDQIKESNGTTLLDNTIFTLGAGMGDGTTHQYNDLPLVVAGGGGGKLKMGKHVHCKRGTPLANLWLTQLRALGIERDNYADSTGTVSEIQA